MPKLLFERRIIDPILNCIKENLDYLTRPENLPQLAKLGFMYNVLWYSGRLCYGYSYGDRKALIATKDQCEDNPKYKLEFCDVGTPEQFNLVYDAWGMHVSNDDMSSTFECFKQLITNGKSYSEVELMEQKPNKTLDEWIELMTHPEYRYRQLFPTPRRVIDYLLCTIGTGFGYQNGFIIEEASGADQDKTLYAGWENATFKPSIQRVVDKILADPDVKQVLDLSNAYLLEAKRKREEEERNRWKSLLTKDLEVSDQQWEEEFSGLVDQWLQQAKAKPTEPKEEKPKPDPYHPYYPICQYSIITKLDENSHISYLIAAYNVCKSILQHTKEESKDYSGNIEFAKKNIKRFKKLSKQL